MNWYATNTAGHETHGQTAIADEDTGKDVAIVYDGKAHAALIAAAPELLAVARRALEYAPNEVEANVVRTAIAKAEGR